MNHDSYDDGYIRAILDDVGTVAMVGASAGTARPSHFVLRYLLEKGFTVIPVNPGRAGSEILGRMTYASLGDIPVPVDMVDIFRNSGVAGQVTDEAVGIGARVVWMQLTVRDDEAAARAEAAGLRVVMDRCPKIEFARLSGEIGWAGVNSRIISSRRQVLSDNGVRSPTIRRTQD